MSQSKPILFVAGTFLLVATALFYLLPRSASEVDLERLAAIEARVESEADQNKALLSSMESLIGRLDRMQAQLNSRPRQVIETDHQPSATAPSATEASAEDASPGAGARIAKEAFYMLMPKVVRMSLEDTASPEEQQAFWEAARNTTMVDDAIARLKAAVEANPSDEDAHMNLADTYVVKLLTIPVGPERGVYGMKAEAEWKTVISNNPDNWDAQFVLAYNYSMYPDFVSKTDEAIAGFENALAIQERNTPKPEHSQTYVQLARLYRKEGNPEQAQRILQQGLGRYPGNQAITKALQSHN